MYLILSLPISANLEILIACGRGFNILPAFMALALFFDCQSIAIAVNSPRYTKLHPVAFSSTKMTTHSIKEYLRDPWLDSLMAEIKAAGPMKSSLIDITHKCNLRCDGCYYFSEGMDKYQRLDDEEAFDAFLASEKARGINMFTVVGGEPALELDRLRKMAKLFRLTVVTNGSLPIPMEGLENIRIAVSFWGDEAQDTLLRGNGSQIVFKKALEHFKDDPRAGFYYTTLPGFTSQIEAVTEKMVANGNFVVFNFYGDIGNKGGAYSHTNGFAEVNQIIQGLTHRFPAKIISSPHINQVIHQRHLFGQPWGYDVCPSVTFDHPENAQRMQQGRKYPSQFRAYYADLQTTRRCCVGEARDCATCTDLWATYAWVVGSMKAHLGCVEDFSAWLFTTYIFYASAGFIDWHHASRAHLPEIYRRFATYACTNQDASKHQQDADDAHGDPKNHPIFQLKNVPVQLTATHYGQ